MKRIAILGGGIAGLSAAHYLHQAGAHFTLFEASNRFGGIIDSERTPEGFLVEAGPDSFLTAKPAATELARELGLADQLIPWLWKANHHVPSIRPAACATSSAVCRAWSA